MIVTQKRPTRQLTERWCICHGAHLEGSGLAFRILRCIISLRRRSPAPPRIEYPSAVCHVTSRGDRREPIAKEDADRSLFLEVVGQAAQRFEARVGAGAYLVRIYKMDNGGPGPIR